MQCMNTSDSRLSSGIINEILSSPSLLLRIFTHLRLQVDLVNCALVCKLWSDPALDVLWHTVSSLERILSLYPGFKKVQVISRIHQWVISERMQVAHWDRFLFYSKRMKSISICIRACYPLFTLSEALAGEVENTHPNVALFPNLKELTWTGGICREAIWSQFSALFLGPGLTTLEIVDYRNFAATEHMISFFQEIISRASNISTFILSTSLFNPHGPDVSLLLSSLPNLVNVTLPQYSLSAEIILALGRLPKLMKLETREVINDPRADLGVVQQKDLFPNLQSILNLHGTVERICQFLDVVSNRHNLMKLGVYLMDYTEEALGTFIRYAAANCRDLEMLQIQQDDAKNRHIRVLPGTAALSSLTRATREALKALKKLKRLYIHYCELSDMTDDDLMELVASLPELGYLQLQCEPISASPPALTLQVLHRLSHYLYKASPKPRPLYLLAIDVNPLEWPDETIDDFLVLTDVHPLKDLYFLSIHSPPFDSNTDCVALYLDRLVPPVPCLFFPETKMDSAWSISPQWSLVVAALDALHRSRVVDAKRNAARKCDSTV